MKAVCPVCFRHCALSEGALGACLARRNRGGRIICDNYGRVTSLALDPIEKKPLRHFFPGSKILSAGSYGCNLRCPFCQNHEISMPESVAADALREAAAEREDTASDMAANPAAKNPTVKNSAVTNLTAENPVAAGASAPDRSVREVVLPYRELTPPQLAALAEDTLADGNIGVAYTYNEALVGYEFVRDTARLVRERGMKNVLVTNGTAELSVLEELLPYIDAMNIDLKGFSETYVNQCLGGNLQMNLAFIEAAARRCHVELTTLIVPGKNDTEEEMRQMSAWIASLNGGAGKEIPYHISRFFPRRRMKDVPATDVKTIYRLAELARQSLAHVYTGNC